MRPLHGILCLLSDETGAQVVPMSVDGINAGNTTQGHRFLGAGAFAVHGFDDYALKLKRNFMMLDLSLIHISCHIGKDRRIGTHTFLGHGKSGLRFNLQPGLLLRHRYAGKAQKRQKRYHKNPDIHREFNLVLTLPKPAARQ